MIFDQKTTRIITQKLSTKKWAAYLLDNKSETSKSKSGLAKYYVIGQTELSAIKALCKEIFFEFYKPKK